MFVQAVECRCQLRLREKVSRDQESRAGLGDGELTFCLLLPLPLGAFLPADEVRGCDPGPGDITRAGTVGGGPGSAAGDRRCIDR